MRLVVPGLFGLLSISVLAQGSAGPAGQPAVPRDVAVTSIAGVISGGATWTIAWQGADNADGLVGMPDGGVLFAQEQTSRVRKLEQDGTVSVYAANTGGAGSVALDSAGRLIAVQRTCTDPGLTAPCSEPTRIAIIHPDQDRRVLAETFEGKTLGRLNDLVVSRQGVVYFTSGGAYSVRPGGTVVSLGENLRTNGIMLSPNEKVLYITNGPVIAAFDVQADGSVKNQREFGKLEGGVNGDGMAIDSTGRLYVTTNPGVQVLSPEGKFLGLIPTHRNSITLAFSGPNKKTLFVGCTGALGPDGKEITTPAGVRNTAMTVYAILMQAQGFKGRAK